MAPRLRQDLPRRRETKWGSETTPENMRLRPQVENNLEPLLTFEELSLSKVAVLCREATQ